MASQKVQNSTKICQRIRRHRYVLCGIFVDSRRILWYNLDKTGITITAKGMNTMRDYYEKLQTETNWFKLFIPYFISETIFLVVFFPIIKYVIEVVIKNKEYSGSNPFYAICVSLIFSAVIAGARSYANRKRINS